MAVPLIPQMTPSEQMRTADVVFVGRVVATDEVMPFQVQDVHALVGGPAAVSFVTFQKPLYPSWQARFEVELVLRGDVPKTLRLSDLEAYGDAPTPGRQYLIVARRSASGSLFLVGPRDGALRVIPAS
ncbi:MAG: hypothetical protein ABI649_02685 [Gaiellaceae bacterium]